MKKLLLIILASIILLSSCNMDATSGIFQSAMNSQKIVTEPIEQIIKKDTISILFTSSKGIYKFDKDGYSSVYSNNNGVNAGNGIFDATTGDIYFTSSVVENNTPIFRFHKWSKNNLETFSDFGLTTEQKILRVVDQDTIFINDETESAKKVFIAKLDTTVNKIVPITGKEISYSSSAEGFNNVGVKMIGDNLIMFFYFNTNDPITYRYYFVDSAKNILAVDPEFKAQITGAYLNDDGTWIATSVKDSKLTINNFKSDAGGYKLDSSFDTEVAYSDRDMVIGKLGDDYFFHQAGANNVHYFKYDGSKTTINTTNYTNFSSAVDFVSILPNGTKMIVATTQNGFYELTSLTANDGFKRIDTLN